MTPQEMMEEIDRLARLCEAKDEEIALAKEHERQTVALAEKFYGQLSEAQAQIAMRAEALEYIHPYFIPNKDCSDRMTQAAEELIECALSATSESVAAWRAKETEPLRREVAMLCAGILSVQSVWEDDEFGYYRLKSDLFDLLPITQATALAYEREVENRGAVKALEEFGNKAGFGSATLLRMIAELRAANKGTTK